MGTVFARPVVLLPLGVVVLLVGLLTALNGVASARWGGVHDDGTACGPTPEGMCLVREDVTVDGPRYQRRTAGDRWVLQPSGGRPVRVDLPDDDSDALDESGATDVVMLSQPDGDVVGIETDGRRIGTTGVGAYGVLQRAGLGILGMSLGAGMVLAGVRMRRATGSWVEHEPLQSHGTAALALPVVVGFVVWMAPRFIW
ncbi:hypothetical protein [Knoellia sp. LjRoot47]|uniref:hypothetical protein n=1 Tax=Knoellia sp. LjRoot47 TaxID=3342330 RepID=UPI003ECD8C27